MATEHEYIELHALAELYHEMKPQDYQNLKLNIKKHGQNHPVAVWAIDEDDTSTWRVIDGRHRQRACQELGIECEYRYMVFDEFEDALQYVKSSNHTRRSNTYEVIGVKERRAMIEAELKKDPNRSDRWIGKLVNVSHVTVSKVRRALKLDSGNRVAADGRVFKDEEAMDSFEKMSIAPETQESAPESVKTTEVEYIEVESEYNDEAETPAEVVEKPEQSLPTASDIVEQMCAGTQQAQRYRRWVGDMIAGPIGEQLAARYGGWKKGENISVLFKEGLMDLRIGWPNIGQAFIETHAPPANARGNTKKVKVLLSRLDDLDKINEANKDCTSEYQRGQMSLKYWQNMSLIEAKKQEEAKKVEVYKGPGLSFHGQEIVWDDIEGMNYTIARAICVMVYGYYDEYFVWVKKAYGGEIPDTELSNFARQLRLWGDAVEAFAGRGQRRIVERIAHAINKHPERRQKKHEVQVVVFNTPQNAR